GRFDGGGRRHGDHSRPHQPGRSPGVGGDWLGLPRLLWPGLRLRPGLLRPLLLWRLLRLSVCQLLRRAVLSRWLLGWPWLLRWPRLGRRLSRRLPRWWRLP